MRLTQIFIVIGICSLPFKVTGQNANSVITLDEAIEQSLFHNQDIIIQENNLKASVYKIKETYSRLLPSLSTFGQFQVRKGGQFIEQQSEFVNNAQTDNFYGAIDASINIFNGFNNLNSIQESKNNKDAQAQLLKRTKQDLILEISTLYLKCLISKELILIVENNLKTQETILEKVAKESELGKRAEIDLYLQKAEIEKLKLELLKANGIFNNDKSSLTSLMGSEPNSNIEVIEPLKLKPEILFDSTNTKLDSLYRIALEKRPDFIRANSNIKAAKNRIRIQGSSILPTLSAFYSYNTGYNSGFINDFSTQIDDNLLNEYGLRLSIPLFNNLKGRSARQQAKVDFYNAELEKEKLELQIKQQIAVAHQNYLEALKTLIQTEKQLTHAELVYDLETERFDLGVSDIKRYSEATDDIIKARSDAIQAKYTLMFQEIFLKYALGSLKYGTI
tara:strand:+ start:21324 stop:22667 length:1344 start_codon:yes stop_codon:yes gene_type:complete